jgi:hypothetical protein
MAEDKWIKLNRKCLRIVKMPLAVLKPYTFVGDPFITLETELSEAALAL